MRKSFGCNFETKLNKKNAKFQIIYERDNTERRAICDRMAQLKMDLYRRCQVPDIEEGGAKLERLKELREVDAFSAFIVQLLFLEVYQHK